MKTRRTNGCCASTVPAGLTLDLAARELRWLCLASLWCGLALTTCRVAEAPTARKSTSRFFYCSQGFADHGAAHLRIEDDTNLVIQQVRGIFPLAQLRFFAFGTKSRLIWRAWDLSQSFVSTASPMIMLTASPDVDRTFDGPCRSAPTIPLARGALVRAKPISGRTARRFPRLQSLLPTFKAFRE